MTDEERQSVVEALKKSQLYDDIASLPKGIDTILTKEFDENGVVLSGCQTQKSALARIFVQSNKEIFILNEASSALDSILESKVNQTILEFCKDKMLILISHRLSACKRIWIRFMCLMTAKLLKAEVIRNEWCSADCIQKCLGVNQKISNNRAEIRILNNKIALLNPAIQGEKEIADYPLGFAHFALALRNKGMQVDSQLHALPDKVRIKNLPNRVNLWYNETYK